MSAMKHPKELWILAATELCERFAFWGVGNLLVLYLIDHFHFANDHATHLYGLFAGFSAFLPLLGGFIADRWNYQAPLFLGALFNAVGCLLLSFGDIALLYLSLFIIACGYGIFTPSILTILGHTYQEKPALREAGFSIYYASINLGVFLALASLGYVAHVSSWRYAFLLAALVQLLGILPILWYRHKHMATIRALHKQQHSSRSDKTPLTPQEKDRLIVIFVLSIVSILFWITYIQGFSSMAIFAQNFTDRMVHGWQLPTGWILSSESFFLLLLAPLLAALYASLQKRGIDPSPTTKTAFSLIFIALCFVVMAKATYALPANATSASLSPFFPVGAYFLMAVGEMLLAPIGLSLVTQLAPRRLTALLVGLWYVCVGLAFYIGGTLAGLMDKVGGLYHFFSIFIFLTLLPALLLLLFRKKLTKLSHTHHVAVSSPPPK